MIETIAETPRRLRDAVAGLSPTQLDTPYRQGGWTVRQVAHHDRWVRLLRSLSPEQFARPLMHPDNGRMTIDTIVTNYAWHGPHHIALVAP